MEKGILKCFGEVNSLLGSDDIEIQQCLDPILKDRERKFVNPDEENMVNAVLFCSWLDPVPLLEFFRDSYLYFDFIKERLIPRIRFLTFLCLSRSTMIAEAYRKLNPDKFQLLGFESTPTYEILREFVNERLGENRFREFFDALVLEIKNLLAEKGVELGRRCGQDASDEPSLKHDKEAKYSGYYKEYGYKFDVVHDLDQETLPIHYTPMEITEDEGRGLIPAQDKLHQLKIKPEEWKIDGKYATYKNIAKSELKNTHLIYKIQNGWIYNPKGSEKEIKRLYQKHWKDPEFKVDPDTSYMLNFLLAHGETEAVGAYYRNIRMERAAKDPEEIAKECGERSGKTEGIMGVAKKETILDRRLPRRGFRAFVWVLGISMMSFAFAALIRLQNGFFDHLGSLTYII
jgi:hypothetical protein